MTSSAGRQPRQSVRAIAPSVRDSKGGRGSLPGDIAARVAALRRIAQPAEYSPSATDHLYRVFSIYVSVPLARLGATPNGITVAWIGLGLLGAVGLLCDSWPLRIVAALLLQLSYLLDFVDGEVARLSDRRSLVGGFLDLVGHGLIKGALPLAVGAAAAADTGRPLLALAGAVAAVVIVVGDALRFYAACTIRDLAGGDLGHAVVESPPARGRRTPWRLVGAAWVVSFESPGLYGLTLIAVLVQRLDVLAVYWALGGTLWFLRRTLAYSRRMA